MSNKILTSQEASSLFLKHQKVNNLCFIKIFIILAIKLVKTLVEDGKLFDRIPIISYASKSFFYHKTYIEYDT